MSEPSPSHSSGRKSGAAAVTPMEGGDDERDGGNGGGSPIIHEKNGNNGGNVELKQVVVNEEAQIIEESPGQRGTSPSPSPAGSGHPQGGHQPPPVEPLEEGPTPGSWERAFGADQPTTFYGKYIEPMMNKGTYSNAATFFIMIIGIILLVTIPEEEKSNNSNAHKVAADYILSFGLFGFAGGITNWLAVKMLFDKIPGLYGSGVIPARFKEIRNKMKSVIMDVFFDVEYLERYVSQKANSLMAGLNLEEKINKMLESPAVDEVIDAKLADLGTRPEGMYLAMMGINPTSLKPMIKPFVLGMGSDMAPLLMKSFNPLEMINIRKLRDEVDALLETKLLELSPEIVKMMMESVIREHLGWLVVWGNVFGGVIGIVTKAAGYG